MLAKKINPGSTENPTLIQIYYDEDKKSIAFSTAPVPKTIKH